MTHLHYENKDEIREGETGSTLVYTKSEFSEKRKNHKNIIRPLRFENLTRTNRIEF